MNKANTLILVASLSVSASSLFAGVANINYGSALAAGGAQFFGSDAAAPDSLAVGFFAADTVNADLTGWTTLGSTASFFFGGVSNTGGGLASVDTTAANGLTAYLLITDGSLTGLVSLGSWATYSGAVTPTPTPSLAFEIGASETSASVTTFAGVGTLVTVTDGEGTDFGGGFSGTGVSISLSAVPEPSTYAALAGLCALSFVMVRRRRA